jgi:hypothetical protein
MRGHTATRIDLKHEINEFLYGHPAVANITGDYSKIKCEASADVVEDCIAGTGITLKHSFKVGDYLMIFPLRVDVVQGYQVLRLHLPPRTRPANH